MLARVAEELAEREISVARLIQHQNGDGVALHIVTHEARAGSLADALAAIEKFPETKGPAGRVAGHLRPWRCGARMGVIERGSGVGVIER